MIRITPKRYAPVREKCNVEYSFAIFAIIIIWNACVNDNKFRD